MKRKHQFESDAMRRFVYVAFVACFLALLVVLATGGSGWLAPVVGTLVTGPMTVMFYLREQERNEHETVVREANAGRGASFDFGDDDDPTQPPTKVIR